MCLTVYMCIWDPPWHALEPGWGTVLLMAFLRRSHIRLSSDGAGEPLRHSWSFWSLSVGKPEDLESLGPGLFPVEGDGRTVHAFYLQEPRLVLTGRETGAILGKRRENSCLLLSSWETVMPTSARLPMGG